MHTNHMGSTSQVTDDSGAMAQDQLYYAWGQNWSMVATSEEKRFPSLGPRDSTATGETDRNRATYPVVDIRPNRE
jgi:hypothetical protein